MKSGSSASPIMPNALGIIGAGRVGSALASHFQKSNLPLISITERDTRKHPQLSDRFPSIPIHSSLTPEFLQECDLILISVQDDHLADLVKTINALSLDLSGKTFVHTSGAYTSHALDSLKEGGAWIASAHPIYAFGNAAGVEEPAGISLEGVHFDLEGDDEAVAVLESVFRQCGMLPMVISADQKIALHLASVFYSNFFVGLAEAAQQILRAANISPQHRWQPFLPLIESTLKNLSRSQPEDALTGPIKRGDVHTIERHLNFISRRCPQILPLYIQMSRTILEMSDLPAAVKSKLEQVLDRQNSS